MSHPTSFTPTNKHKENMFISPCTNRHKGFIYSGCTTFLFYRANRQSSAAGLKGWGIWLRVKDAEKTSLTRLIQRAQYNQENTAHANPQKMFLWCFSSFPPYVCLAVTLPSISFVIHSDSVQPAYSDREMRRGKKRERKLK